jgi:hypothetical protein
VRKGDGREQQCERRCQRDTTANIYHQMILSAQYYEWQVQNRVSPKHPLPTIGMNLFRLAKCACIRDEQQHDCADELEVSVHELVRGLSKLRKKYV